MATLETHITERRHIPDRRAGAAFRLVGGRKLNAVDWVAMLLLIVGGLNWGAVALLNVDLVATVFGEGTTASRVVYALVALAAIYGIYLCFRLGNKASQ